MDSSILEPCSAKSMSQGKCKTSSDCISDGWESCIDQNDRQVTGDNEGVLGSCKHKDVLPLKGDEFWGLLLVFIFVWYGNMGGNGGAGIVLPVSIYFLKFDTKQGIALSNFCIFLSTLIRYLLFANTPHPLKKGKGLLVSYNLSIMMLPMIISGVSVGVIINIIVSDMTICIFYIIVNIYIGVTVFRKALKLYQIEEALAQSFKEKIVQIKSALPQNSVLPQNLVERNSSNQKQKIELQDIKNQMHNICEKEDSYELSEIQKEIQQQDIASLSGIPIQILKQSSEEPIILKFQKNNICHEEYEGGSPQSEIETVSKKDLEKLEKLKKIINYESSNFQWVKLEIQWGMILILIMISLLRGSGNDSPINAERCDNHDWILFLALQTICIIFLLLAIRVIKNEFKQKLECGYQFTSGDVDYTPKNIFILCFVSFFGAVIVGFSGIGGGSIFTPALMTLGVDARVATATGMYITMLTTLAYSIQMIFFRKINMEYAFYLQVMTVLGAVPGIFFQDYILKKYGRVSYQVFLLTGMIFIMAVSVTVLKIPSTIHKQEQGIPIFELFDYCQLSN